MNIKCMGSFLIGNFIFFVNLINHEINVSCSYCKEGVSDCFLTPTEQLFSYVIAKISCISCDDDNVCFVLEA